MKRKCEQCGLEYNGRKKSKYCSKKCSGKGRQAVYHDCLICGKKTQKCRHSKYCSRECYYKSQIIPTKQRFWKNVQKTDYCWNWIGSKCDGGYGQLIEKGNKNLKTHRLSWELHYGKIPQKMCVCHKCDNPSCVRPEHLFLGNMKDNVTDMIKKNRGHWAHGDKHYRAKLSCNDIKTIRDLYNQGKNQSEIARKFQVTPGWIGKIVKNKYWKHVKR